MNKSTNRDWKSHSRTRSYGYPLMSIVDEDESTTVITPDGKSQQWDQWLKKRKQTHFRDEGNFPLTASSRFFAAPKHRTAMGEYIVPEGGKPLSGLDFQLPGPLDYSPEYKQVLSSAPEWSMPGRDERVQRSVTPGPNSYDTSSPMEWNRRKVVLSSRPSPTSRERHGPFEVGPSSYAITQHCIGTNGPRYSIPKAKRDETATGFEYTLLSQPDPLRFTTPAPNQYDVKECQRHRAPVTVITGLPPAGKKKTWPAPCDYFPINQSKSPGGVSMGTTYFTKDRNNVPGPKYDIPQLMGTGPSFTMAYAREPKMRVVSGLLSHPEVKPGPNAYDTRPKRPKRVGFSIRSRTIPTYPASINGIDNTLNKGSPGPAAYFPHHIGDIGEEKRGPDFGRQYLKLEDASGSPGPSDYAPQMIDTRLGNTMTGRWTNPRPPVLPGYEYPPNGVTKNGLSRFSGFTFSSRRSPQIFNPLSRRPRSARAD
ncbi:hypothetical protein C0Q70_15329 [Pomacea canaliculata]|uniref:Sperm-tail PG-rich repeat-containing protein 2 n=1 Tax=Pomacea canaliculata TaxID=400727 RepID=A0A2T7NUK2_POMCA|nr:hypothetical protein C0Q70_15329 [Pomacea canaliculata]